MKLFKKQLRQWLRWLEFGIVGSAALAACAPASSRSSTPELPDREPLVRVGLAVDTAEITLGSTAGFDVLSADGSRTIASFAANETLQLRAGATVLTSPDLEDSRVEPALILRSTAPTGFLNIGGKLYRGAALIRYNGPERLTAINVVPMELYLLGVVPYEIGRVGPELLEASKAQAVAARTYALRYLGRRESLGFDVYATVSDQVYGGAEGEHEPVSRAVLETAGEVLTFRGSLVEAFYHSTCAGRTAAIEEVWPQEAPQPYLVSVVDIDPATGTAFDVSSSRFTWSQAWTADEITGILAETLADSLPSGVSSVGVPENFEILDRTTSGRIARMRITTSTATFIVGGDRIRWIFLTPEGRILNSSLFDLNVVRDSGGTITSVTADGGGWGHGIGMCQVGAMGRARAGQNYRTILPAYYPGTQIDRIY